MKHLLTTLALILSGCATVPADRPRYWMPANAESGWSDAKQKGDYDNCRQLAESQDWRRVSKLHETCMLTRGYVQVVEKN